MSNKYYTDDILKILSTIQEPDSIMEIRIPEVNNKKIVVVKHFTEINKMADFAIKYNGMAKGIYFVLNPIKPQLLTIDKAAGDEDILKRNWLPLDFDPYRPKGTSSTQNEHDSAINMAMSVREYLRSLGWPEPIFADSGNGAHLLYAIDLPNSNESKELVRNVILCISKKYTNNLVEVDKCVHNASRIFKLYGTLTMKGENTEERPHRIARLIYIPDKIEKVNIELLKELANQVNERVTDNYLKTTTFNYINNKNDMKPDFNLIQNTCEWIKHCILNANILSEEEWYAFLSIVGYCNNGRELAHEYSKPHPHYSFEETERKLEHALSSARPRLCENIKNITDSAYCYNCEYCKYVNSPITLGNTNSKIQGLIKIDELVQQIINETKEGNKTAALENEEFIEILSRLKNKNYMKFEIIKQKLQDSGIKVQPLMKIIKNTKQYIDKNNEGFASGRNIESMIVDSPNSNLIIPQQYELTDNGISYFLIKGDFADKIRIASAPILIIKKQRDIDENKYYTILSWKENNKWETVTASREVVSDSKKIISLSSDGFPVNSNNAKDIVKYISELESLNKSIIEVEIISSRLGWQGRTNSDGFLIGKTFITNNGDYLDDIENYHTENYEIVKFKAQERGEQQIANGFKAYGTLEEWQKLIALVREHPRIMLLLYASFAAPLLDIVDAPNFVIDMANRTSTGKTTSLRLAASVWGCPDEKQFSSIIGTWDSTNVWVERTSSMLNGLPLFLDDTKRATRPEKISDILYLIASGRGRGRGNIKSTAETKSFRTILFSTGETPVIAFTKNAGAIGRVLELRGAPFGISNEEVRNKIIQLNAGIKLNYGHAGPKFLQWILLNHENWQIWKKAYNERVSEFAQSSQSPVGVRIAEYVALIEIAAYLVHKALNLGWEYEGIIESLWKDISQEASDATSEEAALQYVWSWANANIALFHDKDMNEEIGYDDARENAPLRGWAGEWPKANNWSYIAFYPHVLDKLLEEGGFNPPAIKDGWKEFELIDVPKGQPGYQKQIRRKQKQLRMIFIKRSAIEILK